jgi:Protein of unknown function (DUF3277)
MSTKRNTVYAPDVVTFNFAAIDCTNGLGTDTFLEITEENEVFTGKVGLDGETVFSHQPRGFTRIKASYLQTSKTNALLSAYHLASELAGGLPAPLSYEDRKGTSKMVANSAVITKLPDEKFGKEADNVTWEFLVAQGERFVGSH